MISPRQINALRKAHNERLYAHAMKLVKNPTDAEDLLQDAWIKIAINYDDDSPSNFLPWAIRIMTNTFLDSKRKKDRRVSTCSYSDTGAAESHHAFADESSLKQVENDDSLRSLLDILRNSMSDREYRLLKMAYVDQVSVNELAQTFSYNNTKAVYTDLKRAKESAKRILISNFR